MPKILHLIPTLSGGGAERQLTLLAAEQEKHGWNVHIGFRRGGINTEFLHFSNVMMHLLGDFKGIDPRLLATTHRLIKEIRPEVIQTWLPQMNLIGGISALWNSIPWIFSERSNGNACQGVFDRTVQKYLARYAHAIVANSLQGVQYWQGLLPEKSQIFQVANAVNVKTIRNAVTTAVNSKKTKPFTKYLLIVGRLAPEKAVDIVIQALSLDSIKGLIGAWIIGDGPLRRNIENKIKEFSLCNLVSLFSYRQDWWGLLGKAVALVSMSRFEGQPNVVLEAMAAGCPVIVSDIPAHREILDEDSALFVQLDNPEHLAQAIKTLLLDKKAALYRANRALNRVSAMTAESAANKYQVIINKVLGKLHK